MQWAVEEGIPIPPKPKNRNFGGTGRAASPEGSVIRSLNVGQCVLIDGIDFGRIRRICVSRTRHKGMRYVTREENGALRVWRVE